MKEKKKRILVVDDNEDLLKLLKLRVESEGYEYMCARDGEEMLELVRSKKPDLILLDIMLPKMDGYTALREIRKEDEFKDIPVIVLSGKEKSKIGDLFVLEKIEFYVEKPFNAKDLLQKIRSVLHG